MSERPKVKLAVLIGGGGRLPAICEGVARFDWQPGAVVTLVLSYKKKSAGLEWAIERSYDARYWRWSQWKAAGQSRAAYDAALADLLVGAGVELIVLAGWGLLLDPAFLGRFAGRVINVHPALLTETFQSQVALADGRTIPVLRGNDAIEQALAGGLDTTGCTVHYVTDQMDTGPILLKREIPILPTDTITSLADRIHAVEDELLPLGIELACLAYLAKNQ